MRRLVPFILFWSLSLVVGCAPAHDRSDTGGVIGSEGTTGATNEKGIPFVTANPRMQQELREPVPAPVAPAPKPAVSPNHISKEEPAQPVVLDLPKKLSLRMQEFEISRFNAGETTASRFGDERFILKIYFGDDTMKFEGKLSGKDGRLKLATKSGNYFITGNLYDDAPTTTEGRFTITNTKTQESARILYSAFKAKLTVREDSSKTISAGSEIEKQIRSLRENTFGWVNNWAVVLGTSFYLVDIVKVREAGADANVMPPPMVAIKGQSLRTGDQDIPAKYTQETFSNQVSLIGNSESEERRWFQTKLLDPSTKEENDIIIDIQSEQSVAAEAQRNGTPLEIPQSALTPPAPPREVTPPPAEVPAPKQETATPSQPVKPPPATPPTVESKVPAAPAPSAPAPNAPSPKPTQQPSVPAPVTPKKPAPTTPAPKSETPAPSTPAPSAPAPAPTKPAPSTPPPAPEKPKPQPPEYKPQTILEPASYNGSFLRIDNSTPRAARMTKDFERNRNLPGVKKWIQNYSSNWNSGWGKGLLMFYGSANAFRPLLEQVGRTFDVSPAFAYVTVIESSYFTGGKYAIEQGGAALGPFQLEAPTARNMKVQTSGVDERRYFAPSACGAARYFAYLADMFPHDTTMAIMGYNQGEGGASRSIVCTYDKGDCNGGDYGRYMNRAKNYKYTFADIASVRAAPSQRIEYVEKKLAAYFISSDLERYGIRIPPGGKLPANGNVFPPQPIADPTCRASMNEIISN